jgi:WD40 repeat protein
VISPHNASRLTQLASLPLPGSFVNALVFSPDNRFLLSADRNREVIRWERGSWARHPLQAAQSSYQADDSAQIHFYGTLALAPDGLSLVTTEPDGTVQVREADGKERFRFSLGARVYSTAISPDGRWLAVGGLAGNIHVVDLRSGQPVADLPSDREYIDVLLFTPDGRTLLAGYERPANLLGAWDTGTWRETWTVAHAPGRFDYHDALLTPDSRALMLGTTLGLREGRNFIEFLDLETRQVVRRLGGYETMPYQMALSPDGALLAAGIRDGSVWIWELATGEPVKVIPPAQGSVMSLAFSPDGTLLALAAEAREIQVWGVAG